MSYGDLNRLPIFPNVVSINFAGNGITSFPTDFADKIPDVTTLHLNNNAFTPAALDGLPLLPMLEYFYVSTKSLNSIPGTFPFKVPNLKELHLGGCAISNPDINIPDFPQLEEIRLNSNGITTFTDAFAERFPGLKRLSLGYNWNSGDPSPYLSNFPTFPNLEYLDLITNNISTLPPSMVAKLPKLTELNLFDNRITSGNQILQFESIITLNLGRNRISSLGGFPTLNSLEELRIGNPSRRDHENTVGSIDASLPGKVPALKKLYIDNLRIDLNSFPKFDSLEYLNMGGGGSKYNSIPKSLETKLPALIEFQAGYNYITTIDNFPNFPNVEKVIISAWGCDRPRFTSMPDSFLINSPKLQELDIYCQGVSTIPVQFLTNHPDLRVLQLRSVPLTMTDLSFFAVAPKLERLYVNWGSTSNLHHNSIRTLDNFPYLPNLTTLNMDKLPISAIPASFPSKVPALTTLNLLATTIDTSGYSSPALLELCDQLDKTKSTPTDLCDIP